NVFNVGAVGAATTCRLAGVIRQRYYRVVYTNGATIQASFSLYVTEHQFPFGTTPFVNGSVPEYQIIASGAAAAIVASDAVSNQSISPITNTSNTGGVQENLVLKYNGFSLDRNRCNYISAGDSGTHTVTFNGITQLTYEGLGGYICLVVSAASGTTPTLSGQLQFSPDGNGTTWINLGPASGSLTATGQTLVLAIFPCNWSATPGATPANLTTGATLSVFINAPLPRTFRLVYTICGTTPSFTFTCPCMFMKA